MYVFCYKYLAAVDLIQSVAKNDAGIQGRNQQMAQALGYKTLAVPIWLIYFQFYPVFFMSYKSHAHCTRCIKTKKLN